MKTTITILHANREELSTALRRIQSEVTSGYNSSSGEYPARPPSALTNGSLYPQPAPAVVPYPPNYTPSANEIADIAKRACAKALEDKADDLVIKKDVISDTRYTFNLTE